MSVALNLTKAIVEIVALSGASGGDRRWSATSYLTTASVSDFAGDGDIVHLQRHLELTRFVVQKVITPALVAFGVIGNLVNIAVLTRRWMKSSTNCYLTALAVYDVLYLVLVFVLSLSHYDSIRSTDWYNRIRKPIVRPLTDTFSNTGVWLTLTFTVERYIGVCHPMKGKVWCTPRRAKVIVVVVCIAAALITFPEFFEWTTVLVPLEQPRGGAGGGASDGMLTNGTMQLMVIETDFGQSHGYTVAYKYINQSLFTFLPLALLSIFNSLLANAVISSARWRQKMSATNDKCNDKHNDKHNNKHNDKHNDKCSDGSGSKGGGGGGEGRHLHAHHHHQQQHHYQQQQQQRITVMLIIVVVVFLLCQTPQAIQHIYVAYTDITNEMDDRKRYILTITANIFNLLVITNCCSNFILYSSLSSKFRLTFHRLFCAPCMTKRNREEMEHLYSDATAAAAPAMSALSRSPRNDGCVDTVVCTQPWPPSDLSISNSRVTTQVAIPLVNEMTNLSSTSSCDGQLTRAGAVARFQRPIKTDAFT